MIVETIQSSTKGEDLLVLGESTFGVIDGATPLEGSHSILVRFIKEFSHNLLINEKENLKKSLERTLFMVSTYDEVWAGEKPSAAVGIVRISGDSVEVARTGDVSIILYYDEPIVLKEARISELDDWSWDSIVARMKRGMSFEEAVEDAKKKEMLEVRRQLGKGYEAIFPGAGVDVFDLKVFHRDGLRGVVIASDGAYRAVEVGLCNEGELLEKDLKECILALRKWEDGVDPKESKVPLFSRHDDASIVRIVL